MKLKYDATDYALYDVGEVLKRRYPHLSYAEHSDRQQTALHEASHLITAIILRTGRVGYHAFVRVPRKPAGMDRMRGASGSVQCSADGWEHTIVCFSGIAAAFISDDPRKIISVLADVADGMDTVNKFVRSNDKQTIYAVRWELLMQALVIVSAYWPVIDLTAASLLLNARKGGGIVHRRFDALVVMARLAIAEADRLPSGHPRKVMFRVPFAVNALIKKREKLPSRILQLPAIRDLDYGYPYE